MRITLATFASLLTATTAVAQIDDPPQGRLVTVAAKTVFVPNGFDDNDEVEVVLDGILPNTCYRLAHNEVKLDAEHGRYVIFQFARRFPGVCIEAAVPFTTAARLGVVPAGRFEVQAIGPEIAPLAVKEAASAGPDDHSYAPVDEARVERDGDTPRYAGILQGRLTNTCMKIEEVRVTDSGPTIEILPILGMVQRDDCRATEVPFSWRVELPAGMSAGRHLMHVRSLNGKAVNTVFTVHR